MRWTKRTVTRISCPKRHGAGAAANNRRPFEVMSMEIWRDIPGYEGKYQASDAGRIRSLSRPVQGVNHYTHEPFLRTIKGRILRPGRFCKSGHVSVVLGRNTSGKPVHQLIARTFIGACPAGQEVLHNNGNPADNRLSNLRYGTRTENILDVYRIGKCWRKLSLDDVDAIRFGLVSGSSGRELASMFNVSEATISRIRLGRSFSWHV